MHRHQSVSGDNHSIDFIGNESISLCLVRIIAFKFDLIFLSFLLFLLTKRVSRRMNECASTTTKKRRKTISFERDHHHQYKFKCRNGHFNENQINN